MSRAPAVRGAIWRRTLGLKPVEYYGNGWAVKLTDTALFVSVKDGISAADVATLGRVLTEKIAAAMDGAQV